MNFNINYYLNFRKSGNEFLDQFIQKSQDLLWIPYNKFENIKYLDEGGFGTIYEAIWSNTNTKVVLKCLNNLDENFDEFLNEV